MFLSKSCVYGIRAVLYVALKGDREYVSIRKISDELNISFHFLTKILQKLTQNELMNSYRGPSGGINLAKSAHKITILDIVSAIDGKKIFEDCMLGLAGCDEKHPCPIHDTWSIYRDKIKSEFTNTTVQDLIENIKKSNLRLSKT
jgi:Rrf2 family iron-sulfur cluster assembly transcriptional regulator